jgi:hypothetical protein
VASFSCVRREDRQAERLLLLQCVNKPQGLPPFLRNQLLLSRPSTSTRQIWLGPGRASGSVIQFTKTAGPRRRHNDGGAGPGGRLPTGAREAHGLAGLTLRSNAGRNGAVSIAIAGKSTLEGKDEHHQLITPFLRLPRRTPGPSPPDESKPRGRGRAQRLISTSTQCQPSIRSPRDSMNDYPCVRPP